MTDDLIERLAADLRPVKPGRTTVWLTGAVLAGAGLAFAIMLAWIGLRADLPGAVTDPIFLAKFGYTLAFALLGLWAALRLSRPGGNLRPPLVGAMLLIAGTGAAGIVQVLLAAPEEVRGLVLGGTALVCPFYVVALSMPVFAVIALAMRRLAPTRLTLAGFAAGLAAGTAGCWVYAFHCGESGLPFITIWYTTGILAMALIGAALGRLVLRW